MRTDLPTERSRSPSPTATAPPGSFHESERSTATSSRPTPAWSGTRSGRTTAYEALRRFEEKGDARRVALLATLIACRALDDGDAERAAQVVEDAIEYFAAAGR